jgi:hypothetical protein
MGIGSSVLTLDTVRSLPRLIPHSHHSHLSLPNTRNDDAAACKTEHIRGDWTSNVERFAQLVQKAGFSLADYLIQFFTFVPDPTGYVAVLRKTDGSLTQCSWHNIPQKLDKLLEREGPKGVRHVTVGVNGSYVVIMNSGAMWWSGVPVRLKQLLEDAERMKRPVAVSIIHILSPNGDSLAVLLIEFSKDRLPLPHFT